MGESFGYSIFEPLAVGTPVVAPHPIRNPLMDKNHAEVLSGSGLLYWNSRSLSKKLELAIDAKWENKTEVMRKVASSRRAAVAARFVALLEKHGL
jgi:glycosyltransferase involved in cell wall biosynthesis